MHLGALNTLQQLFNQGLELYIKDGQLAFKADKQLLSAENMAFLKAHKPDILAYLADKPNALTGLPLTHGQQGIYFAQALQPKSPHFNLVSSAALKNPITESALQKALAALLKAQPMLGASFSLSDKLLKQNPGQHTAIALRQITCQQKELEATLKKQSDKAFSLEKDCLIKALLISTEQGQHIALVAHHIIVDFWGLQFALQQLQTFLQNPELTTKPCDYKQLTLQESRFLRSEQGANANAFWQQQLQSLPDAIELASTGFSDINQNVTGQEYRFSFDKSLSFAIKERAAEKNARSYHLLLASFALLLFKLSNAKALSLGIAVANRTNQARQQSAGHFSQVLPLICQRDQATSLGSWLCQLQQDSNAIIRHQQYPAELLQQQTKQSLYRHAFSFNQENPEMFSDASLYKYQSALFQQGASLDLTLSVLDDGQQFHCSFRYKTSVFSQATIQRFHQYFEKIVRQAAHGESEQLLAIDYRQQNEREIFSALQGPTPALPKACNLAQVFSEQTQANPSANALIDSQKSYSYQALESRANDYATFLLGQNIQQGDNIAITHPRGFEFLAAVLGALKLGVNYTAIDPSYPTKRAEFMQQASHSKLVFGPKAITANKVAPSEKMVEATTLEPNTIACVLFTSGSTGTPKACALSHQALMRLAFNQEFFAPKPQERCSFLANTAFDAINIEIWPCLLHGATLLQIDHEVLLSPSTFASYIQKQKLHHIMITTALFNSFVDVNPSLFKTLKTVMIGGEAASAKHINLCLEQGAPEALWNLYGPTENGSVSTAFHILSKPEHSNIAIGKAIAHSTAYVIDRDNTPSLLHVPGELYVGGKGLANGYLNLPKDKQNVFSQQTFAGGDRVYKTGDSVTIHENGQLYYQGRLDSQVKINGFRIELGEVASALQSLANIDQAIAVVQPPQTLVAYYQSDSEQDTKALIAALKDLLPSFAIPKKLQWLKALPITPNGKIDTKNLPTISVASYSQRPPETATEKTLLGIWQTLFNNKQIGCDDDFFSLGGHSLLAVKMLGDIETAFNKALHISDVFKHPSICQLAKIIDAESKKPSLPALVATKHAEETPAAISQQRLWFMQQLDSNSNVYNMPIALLFESPISKARLSQAVHVLQSRHEALSLYFKDNNGKAFMAVSQQTVNIETLDLRQEANPQSLAENAVNTFANAPFQLDQAPLIRTLLISLPGQKSLVAFCLHHIIADGWSMTILLDELNALLQEKPLPAKPEIGFRDYSVWQQQLLQGDYLSQQQQFWQQQLQDADPYLELPLDYPRAAQLEAQGSVEYFALSKQQTARFRALCQKLHSSSFMVAIAAYHFLLARYCNRQDLCVGFPSANREQPQSQNVVGLFVNNLVLRHRYQAQETVSEFIKAIEATALSSFNHQQLSFDKIIEALAIAPASNYTPFLQASFSLEEKPLSEHIKQSFNGQCKLWPVNWQVAKYDIHLSLFDDGQNTISGQIEYNPSLFKAQSIAQMAKHFIAVLEVFASEQQSPLKQLNFLSEQEQNQQLVQLNNTAYAHPHCDNISQLFSRQASQTPAAIAVADHHQALSYQQLEQKANQLAHWLIGQGVNNQSHVGLCLERSVNVSIALLGILKTGACYVPLLPNTPKQRLAFVLQDTSAALIISQESLALGTIPCPRVNIDSPELLQNLQQQPNHAPACSLGHGLINIIYTSGSTGNPKGVMVGHNAIANRLLWMQRQYPLNGRDVVLQKTPINFDVSVWELFWPLLNGASIFYAKPEGHYDSDYLIQTISEQNISCCHFVPSMLAVFLQNPNAKTCSNLRQVFTSGEALQIAHSEGFLSLLPNCSLHNLYGPTEAAIDVSFYDCQNPEPHSSVPIGKPIDNTQLLVLNPELNLLPQGAIGELYIGGANLANGYLNRAELSAKSFINNPFAEVPSSKLYKTGDIVRLLADGNIAYLGRADHQVKIRGQRIELQDIEQQLLAIDAINEAVVVCQEQRLLAFVVCHGEISEADIKQQLSANLPGYMLPDAIGFLEAMPKTANGKLDRKNLPTQSLGSKQQTFVAPRNETEQQLQQLFEQLLQHQPIGIDDNFFELGGHSLLATQLASLIRQQFQCELALKTLFEQPTIRKLGDSILSQSIADLALDDADLEALLNDLDDA